MTELLLPGIILMQEPAQEITITEGREPILMTPIQLEGIREPGLDPIPLEFLPVPEDLHPLPVIPELHSQVIETGLQQLPEVGTPQEQGLIRPTVHIVHPQDQGPQELVQIPSLIDQIPEPVVPDHPEVYPLVPGPEALVHPVEVVEAPEAVLDQVEEAVTNISVSK